MAKLVVEFAGGSAASMVRVYWDADWEEFQVRIPGNRAATYHTDSYADAVGTARVMAGAGWVDYVQAFDPPAGHD